MPAMKSFLVYWLPPLFYCVLIFTLSAQPSVGTSHDKLAHFAAYAVMAFLFARAWATRSGQVWKIVGFAFFISTFYGVSDEIHQKFVPGRHASVEDVMADALGAIFGGLVYVALTRLSKQYSPNR